MTAELFPVGFYKLDPTDEIIVWVGASQKVVTVGKFQDPKGRSPNFMIEQLDADRFFFTEEQAARDFMVLHGMTEVPDEELEELRKLEEAD